MILLYPLLVVVAVVTIRRGGRRHRPSWSGFAVWCAAGALFTLSLLTGFSIGLFLLPLVVLAMVFATRRAPDFGSALGFLAGAAVVSLSLLAAL